MKVLIIGYGSIGKRHYHILSNFKNIQQCDLITHQNIEGIVTFKSLEDIDLKSYDYFVIASKTYLHYEQLKYLEENVKNKIILVEKPLFNDTKLLKIINNKVFVAYNRRYYPVLEKIKELIEQQKVLSVNIYTGQYLPFWREDRNYQDTYSAKKEEGGGVLLDLSHEIDYINYLFGKMKVFASVNTKISNLEINSDDVCMVIAQTDKNTLVSFTIDYISKEFKQNMIIHCGDFSLFADLQTMILTQVFVDKSERKFNFQNFDKNYSFEQMHNDILENKFQRISTYQEGVDTMRIIDDIKEKNYAK